MSSNDISDEPFADIKWDCLGLGKCFIHALYTLPDEPQNAPLTEVLRSRACGVWVICYVWTCRGPMSLRKLLYI